MPKTKPSRSVGAAHGLTCLLIILVGIGYHGCTLRQPETVANMDTAMISLPSGQTAARAISSHLWPRHSRVNKTNPCHGDSVSRNKDMDLGSDLDYDSVGPPQPREATGMGARPAGTFIIDGQHVFRYPSECCASNHKKEDTTPKEDI